MMHIGLELFIHEASGTRSRCPIESIIQIEIRIHPYTNGWMRRPEDIRPTMSSS
jgi:hypothetical protein